jgi:hypothetical protein
VPAPDNIAACAPSVEAMLMPYGAGDAKVSCMRHELEHVVRASWLVQNDVGHLYLSEGKSSQVKSTTWKSSAVKGPYPR